jgi:hypothetical protein
MYKFFSLIASIRLFYKRIVHMVGVISDRDIIYEEYILIFPLLFKLDSEQFRTA